MDWLIAEAVPEVFMEGGCENLIAVKLITDFYLAEVRQTTFRDIRNSAEDTGNDGQGLAPRSDLTARAEGENCREDVIGETY